jgi:hypothetical protein
LVTDQLHRAQNTGELHADVDPDAAATHLLALLDGLISRLVLGDLTPEHALRVVEDHLDHVFTPGAG